jgi:hypothetical protein
MSILSLIYLLSSPITFTIPRKKLSLFVFFKYLPSYLSKNIKKINFNQSQKKTRSPFFCNVIRLLKFSFILFYLGNFCRRKTIQFNSKKNFQLSLFKKINHFCHRLKYYLYEKLAIYIIDFY